MSYITFHDYKAHSIKTVTIWCGSIVVRLMTNWNKCVQRVRKFLRLIASSKRFLDMRKLSQHHNLSNILYLDCFCYYSSYLNKMCRQYSLQMEIIYYQWKKFKKFRVILTWCLKRTKPLPWAEIIGLIIGWT